MQYRFTQWWKEPRNFELNWYKQGYKADSAAQNRDESIKLTLRTIHQVRKARHYHWNQFIEKTSGFRRDYVTYPRSNRQDWRETLCSDSLISQSISLPLQFSPQPICSVWPVSNWWASLVVISIAVRLHSNPRSYESWTSAEMAFCTGGGKPSLISEDPTLPQDLRNKKSISFSYIQPLNFCMNKWLCKLIFYNDPRWINTEENDSKCYQTHRRDD